MVNRNNAGKLLSFPVYAGIFSSFLRMASTWARISSAALTGFPRGCPHNSLRIGCERPVTRAQSKRNNILTNIKEIDSSLQTGVAIGSHEIPNSSTNRLIFS
jgi:hypothetical protein